MPNKNVKATCINLGCEFRIKCLALFHFWRFPRTHVSKYLYQYVRTCKRPYTWIQDAQTMLQKFQSPKQLHSKLKCMSLKLVTRHTINSWSIYLCTRNCHIVLATVTQPNKNMTSSAKVIISLNLTMSAHTRQVGFVACHMLLLLLFWVMIKVKIMRWWTWMVTENAWLKANNTVLWINPKLQAWFSHIFLQTDWPKILCSNNFPCLHKIRLVQVRLLVYIY